MYSIRGYDFTKIFEKYYTLNSKGWVNVTCPNPSHPDEHPSCGFNIFTGFTKCRVCGYEGNINKTLELLGMRGGAPKKIFELGHIKNTEDFNFIYKLPLALDNEYLKSRGVDRKSVLLYDIRQTKDAVVFPFWNRGHIIGFQKRLYHGDLRYITKGAKPILFMPKNHTPDFSEVYITEGIFGSIALSQLGLQSYAILGTGNVVKATKKLLAYDKVYFCLDSDEAGILATEEAKKIRSNILVNKGKVEVDSITTKTEMEF